MPTEWFSKSTLRLCGTLCLMAFSATAAALSVTDDLGNTVNLKVPARRIISLAPHVTELLFAAGAGSQIVATVKYSDYPEAAKAIPRIGDLRQIDMERVLALKPDLLVVWTHGAFDRQMQALREAGIPLFFSEPQRLEQIPDTLIKLGRLSGTETTAQAAAADFRSQLQALKVKYAQTKPPSAPLKIFYQVWAKPLYTLNDSHIASDAMRLCGAENVFGRLPAIAPLVDVEAVLKSNPDLIIDAESTSQHNNGLQQWKAFPSLAANKNQHLVTLDGDLLNRPGPRILAGARAICEVLEHIRHPLAGVK
ncbi:MULTISPECIES: cobalamin-binding protein [unclassified Undibacterium]|uniref:cobalamin-binding protein n=1 Tax=unclassified Undibacterium TaxID=2630295 RepID=UPI002AC92283|nr:MULTISPECIES: cobalamin-binding protein [unclassified Undibacterium]MEB0139077.1 cobalamin-binding protein [Undibacterium sp. CCC2.1]MEB0172966.1 cobalamin-binding protein [Undibacterium sp. CCC1.1]MEB0177288.1 cobalamin-binding protein [Undibacterium sp. CCC3.4]MEB0215884.1 cobalamin-binding protein [Undibacterium sp. 5I2]WPX42086.1 cobalamin-binding protein [Undibacterium sp. CCC3.4]